MNSANKLTSLILMLLLMYSCSTGEKDAVYKEMAFETPEMAVRSAPDQSGMTAGQVAPDERKIIRNGEISFRTSDISETWDFISAAVSEFNGYISDDNIFNTGERITRRIVIRVPSDNFDALLDRISENVKDPDSKNITLRDVTEEFIDIEARLRTKKELENRYRELLKQARTVEDMLAIEKEMGTLRSDIESIEGRLKYLNDQVSLSTLTVEFYQMTASTLNFSSKIGQAVVTGWRWLIAFLLGLIRLWPFLAIIGIVIFVSVRAGRRKKRKSKTQAP